MNTGSTREQRIYSISRLRGINTDAVLARAERARGQAAARPPELRESGSRLVRFSRAKAPRRRKNATRFKPRRNVAQSLPERLGMMMSRVGTARGSRRRDRKAAAVELLKPAGSLRRV
ncbi:hypothetical protein J6590_085690 [Homalodisca vitripennis]|nr:hypothetical protein J6590_085690 [Homalodisca vitripennis]